MMVKVPALALSFPWLVSAALLTVVPGCKKAERRDGTSGIVCENRDILPSRQQGLSKVERMEASWHDNRDLQTHRAAPSSMAVRRSA